MADETQAPEGEADVASEPPAPASDEVTAEKDTPAQASAPTAAAVQRPVSPVDAEFTPVGTPTSPEGEVEGYEYEIMYLLDPGSDTTQVQEVVERARQIIEQGNGALDNVRTSQVRRLAYEIKGRQEGIYVVLNLRCKPPATRELDRFFKLDERVLRHMILRMDGE